MLGPIFVREWLTVPRRPRHYVVRSIYLAVLWVLGLTAWQMTVGWSQTATLGDNARFGLILFYVLTTRVLLPLIVFFAALSSASTIAREKDRRTFVLLLMTDLRNHEIVLGKFLGSLLPIGVLIASTLPVLGLLVLLGGVAPYQVGEAVLILTGAALAAGSLGGLVALWREKTFQSLALTVLFLVLYWCLVQALVVLSPKLLAWLDASNHSLNAALIEDWQAWLDPFVAMSSVFDPAVDNPPTIAPAYGFAAVMLGTCVTLNLIGMWQLRVWNPSGEPIMQRERPEEVEAEERDRIKAHAAPGAVREVWPNPILWREIRTRAYGRQPLLVKVAYGLVLALICYYALSPLWAGTGKTAYLAAYGLVPVGILSLLLVTAQAVTAITSERDGGALDLLLVTDLTPKEFIFGKLWGIAYNTKEFLLPPIILAVVYACFGLLASPGRNHPELLTSKNAETLVAVIAGAAVLLSFAGILGMHVALRNDKSQAAIVNSLGTVFFLTVGTLVCIYLILINGRFEYQWFSFIFFLAAGIGGLWWVLSGDRPSPALTLASFLCPPCVFYTITNILVGRPGTDESSDPFLPFLVIGGAFAFAVMAMLVPLLSEFDVALGRTTGGGE